jgi:hypothetical protein
MSPVILSAVELVMALGKRADETIAEFCTAVGQKTPSVPRSELHGGEALMWWRLNGAGPQVIRTIPGRGERRRHRRKYAEGDVGPDRSFYFRGPAGKLKLRAQNLIVFLQMAEGVDDETWLYHLRQREYSHWFLEFIKDEELAAEAARIEAEPEITAEESRKQIQAAIEQRYT